MPYSQHSHTVHIDLNAIRGNYRRLCLAAATSGVARITPAVLPPCPGAKGELGEERELAWPDLIAIVKADAYGHGHIPVSRALLEEGAGIFASGCVGEAVGLRRGLMQETDGDDGRNGRLPGIIALLGVMNTEDVRIAAENGIIPLIHCFEQTALLEKARLPLAVALKCNSGMNRLGFSEHELPELLRALARMPHVRPVLALSHLASADTEQGRQSIHGQAMEFAAMLQALRRVFPSLAASLGNTAGTLLSSEIEAVLGAHICRPGLGLYGINPFAGTSLAWLGDGLAPAMSVSAPILSVRELRAGCGMGYGHTFRADRNMRVGIMAAGYADMYPRFMSNHGQVCVKGARAPVLGRVSMQMTAVDLEKCEDVQAGDEAWIMGGPYSDTLAPEELAALWGSISYEVFCLLGQGRREYQV